MKSMQVHLLTLLLLFPFSPRSHGSETSVFSERRDALLSELRSDDPGGMSSVVLRLHQEREATISALLELLRSSEEDLRTLDLKHRAIELLGYCRATEAIGALLGELEFYPPHLLISEHPLYRFPAAVALTEIGEPAVRAILGGKIARSIKEEELVILAYVISYHYAALEERELGRLRMELLLKRAEDERKERSEQRGVNLKPSTRETNLARLIEMYQAIRPRDPKDWPRPSK